MKLRSLFPILICLLLFAAGGCSTAKKHTKPKQEYVAKNGNKKGKKAVKRERPVKKGGTADDVIKEARKWLGTPYRYGGNTPAGVDCSGLVCATYLAATGKKLPRTSAEQQRWCIPVKRNKARKADLVFFTTSKNKSRVSHVGIMIDNVAFIHSTNSRGVIVSRLDESYYDKHFHSIGRVPEVNEGSTAEDYIIEELLRSGSK